MYCLVDYYQCQEWLPGSRCKAQLEKRDPVECFTEQNGLIVRRANSGACLCDTCKYYFVSGSYGNEIPGCGLANCDDFYCPGCDGHNKCQGCKGYEKAIGIA